MACDELHPQILEYLERELPRLERAGVESHLARCAECRAFAQQLEQLDSALARSLRTPALPADFTVRLNERIQTEPRGLSESERAERKRQLEAEFEAHRVRLAGTVFNLSSLLNSAGYAVVAAGAGLLIWHLTPPLGNALAQHGLGGQGQSLALSLEASVVFVLIGLAAAFPRRFRSLWMPA